MTPFSIILVLLGYFSVLIAISFLGTKQTSNKLFFKANQNASWVLVAFGMIGATLSGVTFISVPGWVQSNYFYYMQTVFGYIVGYLLVAYLLIPIYYRLGVTSIYEYLQQRFGLFTYKTGAGFFLLSRVTGAAFRMFLVVQTMQYFVFDHWGIPFELTTVLSVLMIWLYTYKGGIHTIVWTDTLQTACILSALGIVFYYILDALGWDFLTFYNSKELAQYHNLFQWDNFFKKSYAVKSFIGGLFIAVCMTGLDQDMMQKTLSCPDAKSSQKNLCVFTVMLTIINYIFLLLGALLFIYAEKMNIVIPLLDGNVKTDLLFPQVAINSGMPMIASFVFILGLIAAAYSSADSALTSLTTCVCVDFLDIKRKNISSEKQVVIRKKVHVIVSLVLIVVVILYKHVLDQNVISGLLVFASFTYGPLLGVFAFGIFTSYQIKDDWYVPLLMIVVISIVYKLSTNKDIKTWLGGYEFGLELLPINGILCAFVLLLLSRKKQLG